MKSDGPRFTMGALEVQPMEDTTVYFVALESGASARASGALGGMQRTVVKP